MEYYIVWINGAVGKSKSAVKQKETILKFNKIKNDLMLPNSCKDWLNKQYQKRFGKDI